MLFVEKHPDIGYSDRLPYRLNEDLSDFVSTIYSKKLKPQKSQTNKIAKRLLELSNINDGRGILNEIELDARDFLACIAKAMLRKPQGSLRPPRRTVLAKLPAESQLDETAQMLSLALIQLRTHSSRPELSGMEAYVRGEAALAAALVRWLQHVAPHESVFVATPHRIQRHAVRENLKTPSDGADLADLLAELHLENGASGEEGAMKGNVTVDTIERLQGRLLLRIHPLQNPSNHSVTGSEASFVICLFSLPSSQQASLNFMLDRRRLNVALSRAKTLCILITSPTVLRPNVRILADPAAARGWAFLRSYEERAWIGDIDINLDDVIPATEVNQTGSTP